MQAANSKRERAKQGYLNALSGARTLLTENIMEAVAVAAAQLVDVYSYSTKMSPEYRTFLGTAQKGEDIICLDIYYYLNSFC